MTNHDRIPPVQADISSTFVPDPPEPRTPSSARQSPKQSPKLQAADQKTVHDAAKTPASAPTQAMPETPGHKSSASQSSIKKHTHTPSSSSIKVQPSEWSHQQLVLKKETPVEVEQEEEAEWQEMPAYAPFDIYNDHGKLVAKEQELSDDDMVGYGQLGGAGKGYTRVQLDEDAQSATSMDENTAYLFNKQSSNLLDEDEEARDLMGQMQTTKGIMTETQKIAYVGTVRLAMIEMVSQVQAFDKTRSSKKVLDAAVEAMKMWAQKIIIRLYAHMEIEAAGNFATV